MSTSAPVILLTGAAGQLGAAIARSLAARGASLVLVDISVQGLEAVRNELGAQARVVTIAADVTAEGAAEGAVQSALESFSRLDGLVNNAGIEGPILRIEEAALDEVRRVFDVNVFATLRFMQAVLPHFRSRGSGRIVNMASGAGLAGTAYMAPYSASKHAVVGLTRSTAGEVAGAGIQVNAVCPGCVDSPMMTRIEARLGELLGLPGPASFVPSIPAGKYADPAEVAEMVTYLALEAPAYVTGTSMVIDGGLRA